VETGLKVALRGSSPDLKDPRVDAEITRDGAVFRLSWRNKPPHRWDKGIMTEEIRRILRENARLSTDVDTLSDDADLYQAGMTSHASVNVMLALEDAFDVEFPDSMLKRSVFESVAAIQAAVSELQGSVAA
jgi:acyl carrier protein